MPSTVEAYIENSERRQDKVYDAFAWFQHYGYVVHPKSRRIYVNLATHLKGQHIIEAGCGIGLGSAVLSLQNSVIATDKELRSVAFAREIYPWLRTAVWDIGACPYVEQAEVVVAVEVIEHIGAYAEAMQHLLATATQAVWLSTPNRRNTEVDDCQSKNQFHVREFLPEEICELAAPHAVEAYHWDTFEPVDIESSEVTPLVYKIVKEGSLCR